MSDCCRSCESCKRKRKRTPEEYKALINRLNRVEGQIRGIKGMIDKEVYCIDILTQAAAANAALNSFIRELLGEHLRTCIADDLKNGNEETVDELLDTLKKFMK